MKDRMKRHHRHVGTAMICVAFVACGGPSTSDAPESSALPVSVNNVEIPVNVRQFDVWHDVTTQYVGITQQDDHAQLYVRAYIATTRRPIYRVGLSIHLLANCPDDGQWHDMS